MLIPYGLSNFKLIRDEHYFYIDKTHFIPGLERVGRHLLFLRPRRMGKSLFLSTVAHYDCLPLAGIW